MRMREELLLSPCDVCAENLNVKNQLLACAMRDFVFLFHDSLSATTAMRRGSSFFESTMLPLSPRLSIPVFSMK